MGQQCTYSTTWEKIIVVIINIYGARDIFLIFCVHQDTKSEYREMDISIAWPIYAHKKNQSLYETYMPIIYKMRGKNVVTLNISRSRAIFLLFCVHQYTPWGAISAQRHWWIFEWTRQMGKEIWFGIVTRDTLQCEEWGLRWTWGWSFMDVKTPVLYCFWSLQQCKVVWVEW